MVQLPWKTVWKFLKNLKIQLPHDSEIPLWGVYPKEMKLVSQRENVNSYVHHRIVHGSHDMKTTQISIDG